MTSPPEVVAILVAAGRGERMGADRPKAFVEVAGQVLLVRAARALERAGCVDAIVAVVPEECVDEGRRALSTVEAVTDVVAGGPRRQDSVLEGLKRVPDGFAGVVLVHDAARPFVAPELVGAVARAATETGAALPAVEIADTVKRVREGMVVETLDRAELATAQTPQGFRFDLLVRAYEQAFRDRVTVTDEAMAVERIGAPVAVVPGSTLNRKLTTPDDLHWAEEALAAARVAR
jgi:2-C-methyl-D-erythritol 4-phosphate cytidylyltransferase